MKKKNNKTLSPAELRRKAAQRLRKTTKKTILPKTNAELRRLVEELQTHQIELEIVNEELLQSRAEVEKGLEQYTDLYDFAPVGYFGLTRDGRICRANLTGGRLLGVERSRLIKRRFGLFVSPDFRKDFDELLQKAFERKTKASCELLLKKEGDEQLYAQVEASMSTSGQECNIMVVDITELKRSEQERQKVNKELEKRVVERTEELRRADEELRRDVTERKQSEEDLRLAFEWHQAIFEGSRDAIFISDQDSCFVAVNNAASDLTGYSREQLLKMHIPDIHAHADLDAYKAYHQRIFDGEEILSEAKILRIDGAKVDTEFSNKRVSIAGRLYMHTIARDVTERKRAEEQLRLDHEIISNIHDGVSLVRNSDGVIIFVNRQFEKMFGYNPEELIGKHVSVVNAPTEKNPRETAEEIIVELNKHGIWRGRVLNIKKDGTTFWSDANVTSLNIERAGYGGVWVSVHRDVTERKRAEEKLHRKEEHHKAVIESIFRFVPEGVLVLTKSLNPLKQNKAFDDIVQKYAPLLGYTEEELAQNIIEQLRSKIQNGDTTEINIENKSQ